LNGSNKILKPDFDHFFTFLETQAEAFDAEFKLVQRHKRVQQEARQEPTNQDNGKGKGKNNKQDKSNKNDKNEQKNDKEKPKRSEAWRKEFQRWQVDPTIWNGWSQDQRKHIPKRKRNALNAISQAEAKGKPLPPEQPIQIQAAHTQYVPQATYQEVLMQPPQCHTGPHNSV
jgi:hypothetical protein